MQEAEIEAISDILYFLGEDPSREGLRETPKRVVKSWGEIYSGYGKDPKDLLTTFMADGCDQMVLLKDIEIFSMCLAGSTFIDTPKGRIPISKLKNDEWVYCWDESNNKMTIAQAKNPRITGYNKQLWRIYSDKDTILCTGNHKFLTHTRGWVEARKLIPGDSIVALNKGTITENGVPRAYLSWTGKGQASDEHRFIFEEIHGPITTGNHIHHIDKRANNNSPDNLESLSQGDHSRLHKLEDGPTGFALFTDKQRQDMKVAQVRGVIASQTESVRKQRAESVKRHWDSLTEEQRFARNHRVLLVEKTDWFEDVWCMDVPEYHNFVANGMVVHNCEHHMLPFFGIAHVAYIPSTKVIGISKLARLVDMFARRLQIQERIGEQVTTALMEYLQPLGAACVIEATHMCMRMRGVSKQHSTMVTSSMKGVFLTEPSAKQELLQLIRK